MKTPFLLVSGWAHTAEALRPLADRLARRRPVRVLAAHELGEGSDRSDESDRSDPAAGLLREMEREKTRCILAGWSMGGMIALETAVAFPERTAALVLISSAPRLAAAPDFPQGVALQVLRAMRNGLRKTPERTLGAFFREAAFPVRPDTDQLRARVAAALDIGADRLAEQLGYLMDTDLRETARRLTVPVLLLHGHLDRIIPAGAARWITAQRNDTTMITWRDTGHTLPLDHPDRVAAEIERFLKHPP